MILHVGEKQPAAKWLNNEKLPLVASESNNSLRK